MSKFTSLVVGVLMALGVIVPAFALAQTPGNGLLTVYVQVSNPTNGAPTRNSGDFSVLVAGQNPSPATFFGSINGTQVSLGAGNYSVAISGNNLFGYTPTYSTGCSGSIASGQTALCIITMSAQYNNYPYPFPYPYPYTTPTLSCQPQHQTVGLGQSASFTAVGGVGGTYNWTVPGRNFPNVGPVLTTTFDGSGSQIVTVTNASQSATCEVTVTNTYFPTFPTPTVNPTYPNYPINVNPAYPPTLYPSNPIPTRLPNTGIEPLSAVQLALALALLAGMALVAAPYVRKAFAIVTR